jgi:hypothetical protein
VGLVPEGLQQVGGDQLAGGDGGDAGRVGEMISAATRPAAAVAGTRSWGAKKASRGLNTGWGEIRQDTPAAGEERALPARRAMERRRAPAPRTGRR